MNTKFSYLYRDASNYKNFHEVIFSGTFGSEEIEPFLKEHTFFIPSEVGLPDLQSEVFTTDDHIWHEIDCIEPTNDTPTTSIKTNTFLKNFRISNNRNWNEYEVFKRKGLI